MSLPTIFLSAATIDLGEWRGHLHRAFSKAGFRVITQDESLGTALKDVHHLLVDAVSQSDCIIHLAGVGYGSHADAPFPEDPDFKCSWTQFEYYYAHSQGKKVIAFVCAPDVGLKDISEKGTELEQKLKYELQQKHRERVASGRFDGTPLAATVKRTSNKAVETVPSLLEEVASAVGTLHQIGQEFRVRAATELTYVAASLAQLVSSVELTKEAVVHLSMGHDATDVTLKEIATGVSAIALTDRNRVRKILNLGKQCLMLGMLLLILCFALADACSGRGRFDLIQVICVAIAVSSFLLLFRIRRWFIYTSVLLASIASLILGALEPWLQCAPFYFVLLPSNESWAWSKCRNVINAKQINLIVIRDPMRRWAAPWLSKWLMSPSRELPIHEVNGTKYVELPLKGKLEGRFFDGLATIQTLEIPFEYPHLELNYESNRAGFLGSSMAYSPGSSIVESNAHIDETLIPWSYIKLPIGDDKAYNALLYACILNEGLEKLMDGEKATGMHCVLELISRTETNSGPPTAPDLLEKARLLTLRMTISRKLWRGSIGGLHSAIFSKPAEDSILAYLAAGQFGVQNATEKWIVSSLSSDEFGKNENLRTLSQRMNIANTWTSPATTFAQEMAKFSKGLAPEEAETLNRVFTSRIQLTSCFDHLESEWDAKSATELADPQFAHNLSASEKRKLMQYFAMRIMFNCMSTAADSKLQDVTVLLEAAFNALVKVNTGVMPAHQEILLRNLISLFKAKQNAILVQTELSPFELSKSAIATPFVKRIAKLDQAARNLVFLEPRDLDFSAEWWEDSFLHSFANLLSIDGINSIQMEEPSARTQPTLESLLKKLQTVDVSKPALLFFSRDQGGAGHLNLPWLIFWECVAKGHAWPTAHVLDRICQDVTRNAFSAKSALSCFDLRMRRRNDAHFYSMTQFTDAKRYEISFNGVLQLSTAELETDVKKALELYFSDHSYSKHEIDTFGVQSQSAESIVEDAVLRRYRDFGFINAKASTVNVREIGNDVQVFIDIKNEGDQFFLNHVSLQGNQRFNQEVLLGNSPFEVGGIASMLKVKESCTNIHNIYRKAGYADVWISPRIRAVSKKVATDRKWIDVVLSIVEGDQCYIENFEFSGTLPWGQEELLKLTKYRKGDLLDCGELTKWEEAIGRYYAGNGYPHHQIDISPLDCSRRGMKVLRVDISQK